MPSYHRLLLAGPLALALAVAAISGLGCDDAIEGDGGLGDLIAVLAPDPAPANAGFVLTVTGKGFLPADAVLVDGIAVPTTFVSHFELLAEVPAMPAGNASVRVVRDVNRTVTANLKIGSEPPVIANPGPLSIDEETSLTVPISATDPDGGDVRIFLTGLPPGAVWNEAAGTLNFTPDFIQGGQQWTVTITADDGVERASENFTITVTDTITPPAPVITGTTTASGYWLHTVRQTTDAFLGSPGDVGRTYTNRVNVPTAANAGNKMPVRILLHGFGASGTTSGANYEFRIAPHDPDNTYWWGYSERLPGNSPTTGTVPPYTLRRVLNLLEWVLDTHPGADANRVYVTGGSMGGAGAAILGLLHARHFCYVYATIGQTIARNHRPSRIGQLQTLWGTPALNLTDGAGMGVWDRQDLSRALRDRPEARQQFIFTKHGKDDPTIHFGAVTHASPITGMSFYTTLQTEHIGHYAVWDEGGHGSNDPIMGAGWWDSGFSPVWDAESRLQRNLAFPAFTHCSIDRDPGDGTGNGNVAWSNESGYAASVSTAGDTGWNGEIAGARNRFLRWNAGGLIDTIERFELPLKVVDGNGTTAPLAGYPTIGDKLDGVVPVTVDVTPRRTQAFRCKAGETIAWEFGNQSGTTTANADGSVTVTGLQLSTGWQTLILSRPAN